MTIFGDTTKRLAQTIGEVMGNGTGGVTYQARADDWSPTGPSVLIPDAVITDRGNEGAHDEDARFYQRAIELQIRTEVLPAPLADKSTFTVEATGEVFRRMSHQTIENVHHVVAVRAERTLLTGTQPRHVRSRPGQVAGS